MKNFFDKEEYTEADILQLIDNKIEESLTLEFKEARALVNTSKNKNELAKDVSSFANSTGGIIIYGIKESDDVASEVSFIDGSKVTKEWIEQIINTLITKRVPNVKIYPIRFDNQIEKTIYIVKILESSLAPHMANNKYYRRYNFQVISMAEYEIRNLYFKSKFTKLEILLPYTEEDPQSISTKHFYSQRVMYVRFCIKNISPVVSNGYKLELLVPEKARTPLNDDIPDVNEYYIENRVGYNVYIIRSEKPVFQFDTEEVFGCYLNVSEFDFKKYGEIFIYLTLSFDGGRRSRKYSLKEIIEGKGTRDGLTLMKKDIDM